MFYIVINIISNIITITIIIVVSINGDIVVIRKIAMPKTVVQRNRFICDIELNSNKIR